MAAQVLSREELGGRVEMSATLPAAMDALVLRLVGFFASNPLHDEVITYPSDWWQAVKARFCPAWALKRWPVVMTSHTIKAAEVATKLKLPKNFGPTIVMTVETDTRAAWREDYE
jgi:hypothetical protein